MVTGLIGKKLGMTQIFASDGSVQPATVLKAGPCVVAQVKTVDGDGYEAVQLGFVDARPDQGEQADHRPLQEGRRAAHPDPPRGARQGRRRGAQGRRHRQRVDLRRRRARGRHRHQPRQGLPGRRQAAPLRRRPRHARLDVPPRAGLDWRLVVSVARGQGHADGRSHGRSAGDGAEPARAFASTPRTTCCWSRAPCPAGRTPSS